jgi:hypothetical protein
MKVEGQEQIKEKRTILASLDNITPSPVIEVTYAIEKAREGNITACQGGEHANVVWDKDNEGSTIVYCSYCHQIMYDGKELKIRDEEYDG